MAVSVAYPGNADFRDGFELGHSCRWDKHEPAINCDGYETTVFLSGGVTLELIRIPAGTFLMGSPDDERGRYDREDLHEVTLTEGIFLSVYEITRQQWEAVTGTTPWDDCEPLNSGPTYPAECVSWFDVAGPGGFVEQLNQYLTATNQDGAGFFRLPTEAEWERAARAGNQLRFSHGDALECEDHVCYPCAANEPFQWWCSNNYDDHSQPVGTKLTNGFGLYDMHGSVWEWVNDWYTRRLGHDPVTDPLGPDAGTEKINRGGCYAITSHSLRSASRHHNEPQEKWLGIGFRIARSP